MFFDLLFFLNNIGLVVSLKEKCSEFPFISTTVVIIISIFVIFVGRNRRKFTKHFISFISISMTITFIIFLHLRWDSYSKFELQRLASEKILPKSIHFIGDSHTALSLLPMGFIFKLRSVLPDTKITQESYSGYTISEIFEAINKTIPNRKHSNITVIFAGTNDSVQNITVSESIHGMKEILNMEAQRSTQLFVITPHSVDTPEFKENCSSLSRSLKSISKSHNCKIIDWYKDSYGKKVHLNDKIHLNATGHTALAKLFIQALPQI